MKMKVTHGQKTDPEETLTYSSTSLIVGGDRGIVRSTKFCWYACVYKCVRVCWGVGGGRSLCVSVIHAAISHCNVLSLGGSSPFW